MAAPTLPSRAAGVLDPHDRRDARPRPPRHRHHPDALDRRRPAGEFRASGRPDGRGPDGLHDLDAVPAACADGPDMAGPRPVRAQRGPREHAAVLAPAPDRVRRHARRPQVVPPVGQPHAGSPGVRPDAPASRRRPDRWARASRTRSGWRSPNDAWPRSSTGTSHEIVDHWTYVIASDGDLQEGHRVGGVQPRRAPPARQARGALRRQPHPARWPDRDGLVRGRRGAVRRLRLGCASRRRRQRRRRDRGRHRCGSRG